MPHLCIQEDEICCCLIICVDREAVPYPDDAHRDLCTVVAIAKLGKIFHVQCTFRNFLTFCILGWEDNSQLCSEVYCYFLTGRQVSIERGGCWTALQKNLFIMLLY